MQSNPQREKKTEKPAAWMRWIALVCILMVGFMSAAQACHTHAEASSLRQSSHQNQPSPEDHCLVCVAMHTAIPAGVNALEETTVDAAQYVVPSGVEDGHSTIRAFDLQTRPPPVA